MDVLRRTRGYKHGFMVLNGDDVLYPQYDLVNKAREFVAKKMVELKPEARKLLKESPDARPAVLERWREIARTR
jgi:hypothetical protein